MPHTKTLYTPTVTTPDTHESIPSPRAARPPSSDGLRREMIKLTDTVARLQQSVDAANDINHRLVHVLEKLDQTDPDQTMPYNPHRFRDSVYGPGGK